MDRQRLGKQRIEALLILYILRDMGWKRWKNHPAVRMWRGHEAELIRYGVAMCEEWIRRGYRDTTKERLLAMMPAHDTGVPDWMGDERLHASHRSNLLRKNFEYYRQFGWNEPPDLPYYWPVPMT